MKKSFLLLALMLTACTPKKRVEFLYQDTKGAVYEAYCSGTSQSMGVCYRLANQTCGGNFEILNKEEISYQDISSDFDYQISSYNRVKRTLIFRCE